MDSKEIVRDLLLGSAEINRMRAEIEGIINMLMHSLHHEDFAGGQLDRVSGPRDAEATWSIQKLLMGSTNAVLECWINSCTHRALTTLPASKTPFVHTNVQRVHESLYLLIELFQNNFPGAVKRWQPFLDAAKVARRSE